MAKIVCAWCGRVLEEGDKAKGELASHVICEACYEKESRLFFHKVPLFGEPLRITDFKFYRFLLNVALLCVFIIALFIFGVVATDYVIGRFYPNGWP